VAASLEKSKVGVSVNTACARAVVGTAIKRATRVNRNAQFFMADLLELGRGLAER